MVGSARGIAISPNILAAELYPLRIEYGCLRPRFSVKWRPCEVGYQFVICSNCLASFHSKLHASFLKCPYQSSRVCLFVSRRKLVKHSNIAVAAAFSFSS